MSQMLKHIVVVGDSVSAWLSSAALVSSLSKYGVKISHCAPGATTKPLGNMSIRPEYSQFLDLMGVQEAEFMRASHANFKLANHFINWNSKADDFYHAFGEFGTGMANVQFSQAFTCLQLAGLAKPVDTYSLGAQLARMAKFCHPNNNPNSILSTLSYGWNIDADAHREYLKELCLNRGVQLIDMAIENIEVNESEQLIKSLILQDNSKLTADLFIDSSDGGMLVQALGRERQCWQQQLPSCDVATIELPLQAISSPNSIITAHQDGWFTDIATKQKLTRQFYFSGKPQCDELSAAMYKNVQIQQQHFGCMTEPWVGNCLAIGRAAINLPDLCSSEIDLTWLGIRQLIEQCPILPLVNVLTDEYNRLMTKRYNRLKDVTCLHLHLADGQQGELWQHISQSEMSEDLSYKIKLYQRRGKLPLYDEEVIPAGEQISLLMGLALSPQQLDLMVQQVPIDHLQSIHQKIELAIEQVGVSIPFHADYVQTYCYQ